VRSVILLVSIVLLISAGSFGCGVNDSTAPVVLDEVVVFPDPSLESVIRKRIDKPDGDTRQSDLRGLTELSARNDGITDLAGLEHCINLETLNLSKNQIADLSPLSSLSKLSDLDLYRNNIVDLSPLSSVKNLGYLNLNSNLIADISPLSELPKLIELDLCNNQITDITPLANLGAHLNQLCLANNQISDITPLINLVHIGEREGYSIPPTTDLELSGNQISDIGPLVDMVGLSERANIDLRDNPLSATSMDTYIPQLQVRGVGVAYVSCSDRLRYSHGYLRFSWLDDPPEQLELSRGEEWSGTLLVQFLSQHFELTEVDVYINHSLAPSRSSYGTYYHKEDGTKAYYILWLVQSYDPNQTIVTLKDGETFPITLTLRIPEDFPETIPSFRLSIRNIVAGSSGVFGCYGLAQPEVIVKQD